jgi:hypothetical protein
MYINDVSFVLGGHPYFVLSKMIGNYKYVDLSHIRCLDFLTPY